MNHITKECKKLFQNYTVKNLVLFLFHEKEKGPVLLAQ